MHAFCTRCGHRNEDPGAFCDNCGAPLKKPAAQPAPSTTAPQAPAPAPAPQTPPRAPAKPLSPQTKKRLLVGAGLALVLLVGGGGGLVWWLQPPKATPDNLLASARSGWSEDELKGLRQQLCIDNTDYRINPFNVNPFDERTRAWLDTLVTAGLYSAPETIPNGDFGSELLQYQPTPELEKHRDGSRLCVASGVEFTAVENITPLGEDNADRTTAQVTVQAKGLAPWMNNPAVRDPMVNELNQWEWKDGALQRSIPMAFMLKDRQWVTGAAIQSEARQAPARASSTDNEEASASSSSGSWWNKLMSMFSFSSNPLHGTWRLQGARIMGFDLPAGAAPNLTFNSDSVEVNGETVPVTYQVDGDHITVSFEGNRQDLVFVMHGKNEMMMAGTGMRYQRVE